MSQPQFSLAYLTVFGTPPGRMVQIAAETGYDFVSFRLTAVTDDEPRFPFFTDPTLVSDVRNSLRDAGIAVLDVELVRTDPGTTALDFKPFMDASAELGARHIVTQIPEPDRSKATSDFAGICDLAAPYGMTVDLEFIPWSSTRDLRMAADIVIGADRPNGGILVDTLHFERSGSSLNQLSMLDEGLFNFVQLCDATPAVSNDPDELIRVARSDRYPPGEASIDLAPIVRAIPQVPYSLEVPNEAMKEEMGVMEYSRRVLDSARALLDGMATAPAEAAQS
ncbi:MAG TPA: sugar phosphate isomerase/epimerase [Acidimicrobiia bacterium]|nr:sugar phosphate isomerase/epimerase [Acidimicrobiia bacterium]